MEVLEAKEKIEEAGEGAHHPAGHRRIGIVIAVLAALLALTEAGGKSAQTEALDANVRASDLWSFFQAKTIRSTVLRTAVETAGLTTPAGASPEVRAATQKQVDAWNATIARYESDPQTKDGRKELTEQATEAEQERDHKLSAYHMFEYASAASQLAIVLASAAIVSGIMFLFWAAIGTGVIGFAFGLLGWLAPTALHL